MRGKSFGTVASPILTLGRASGGGDLPLAAMVWDVVNPDPARFARCNGGTVLITDPGNWPFPIQSGVYYKALNAPTTKNLSAIARNGARQITVGQGGTIWVRDGVGLWTPRTAPTTRDLVDIAYGNGLWLAVGDQTVIRSTDNGETWVHTAYSPDANGKAANEFWRISKIEFGNGFFVILGAVENLGGSLLTNLCHRSTGSHNGDAFANFAPNNDRTYWSGLMFGNGWFIAVYTRTSDNYQQFYSSDGSAVFSSLNMPVAVQMLTSMGVSNGLSLIGASTYDPGQGVTRYETLYATNGRTFTQATPPYWLVNQYAENGAPVVWDGTRYIVPTNIGRTFTMLDIKAPNNVVVTNSPSLSDGVQNGSLLTGVAGGGATYDAAYSDSISALPSIADRLDKAGNYRSAYMKVAA